MALCLLHDSLSFLDLACWFSNLGRFWPLFHQIFFSSAAFSLSSPFWDSHYMYADILDVVPQVSKALLIFFSIFFLWIFQILSFLLITLKFIDSFSCHLKSALESLAFHFSFCIFNFLISLIFKKINFISCWDLLLVDSCCHNFL